MATNVILYDDLCAVERDAGTALDRMAQPRMFDRLDWFKLAAEYTLDGDPLIVRASNAGASCWLFLSRQGSYADAMSNWYCLRYGTVTHGAAGVQPPIPDVVDGLAAAGISHLYLSPLGADEELRAVLRRKGWVTRLEKINVSWRIDTKGMSFEDYWASRPSRLRNTAARKARKVRLEYVVHDRFDSSAWADLEAVFEASWKIPEGSPMLIREIARQEGEAGTLRIGLAYNEGVAVAAQIWTVENGVATIHKLAYREDARDLSAGTLLSVEMFRRALDLDRVDMIDFGIGDDGYKRDWMSHCVPLYGLTAYYPFTATGMVGLIRAIGRKLFNRTRVTAEAGDVRTRLRR